MKNKSHDLTSGSKRESFDPIPDDSRIFGLPTYIGLWISSMVVIQIFIVGQAFLPPAGVLNVTQAVTCTILSGLIIWLMFSLNSVPGHRYGIPFVVQGRPAFGYKGTRIAALIRVLPAIFWYGIGSWIGAQAIVFITTTIWGFGNVWVYFILFQIVQTFIAFKGIEAIKWFDAVLSIVVLAFIIYIPYLIFKSGSLTVSEAWLSEGTWGRPFFAAITAGVGVLITAAINNGDIVRYLKNDRKSNNYIGHFFGIFPMFCVMLLIGVLSAAATGIWDPITAIVSIIPNKGVAIAMMIFIIVAQVTSNLTINIKPPALLLIDVFNMTWGTACIVVGFLGIATFPWLLLTSSGFFAFIGFYSAFLGPLLGILLADFYIIRRGVYLIEEELYNEKRAYNWLGLIILIFSGCVGILFLDISWMISLPLAMVLYVLAYKLIPKYKREIEDREKLIVK